MALVTRLSGRGLGDLLPALDAHPGPRYAALARAITALLLDGRIAPGTKLPSERELAASLGLSRATVTSAYDGLRGEGILTSRTGSGSVTALPRTGPDRSGLRRGAGNPFLGAPATWRQGSAPGSAPGFAFSSAAVPDDGGHLDLTCAVLPAPPELLAAAPRAAARLGDYTSGGGYEPSGLHELRSVIAARFAARGVPTEPDQILVTNGAQHGVDLVLRMLVAPGDRVLTELPTYSGLLDAIRANAARVIAVPMAPAGGWQLGPMVAALRQNAPVLAVVIPDFHNPTGFLAPAADRRELVRAARRAGTTLLVDESFVDLGFVDPETPMAALDPAVITVGSLSKPIWGGLRVGWVRASAEVIHRLTAVRAAVDMGQAILDQLLALEVFTDLDTIVARRRTEIEPRRDALHAALGHQFPGWRSRLPDGGLSLWVELDAPLATALAVRASQYGLRVVAGPRFGLDGTMERFLRLPYALPAPELTRAVELLAAAWADLDASATGFAPLIVA